MPSRLLLSFSILLTTARVAAAQTAYDALEKEIAKQLSQFGTIEWVMASPSLTSPVYYFQMAKLTFPGGSFPVIFPINCTLIGGKPGSEGSGNNFFCSAAAPGSVGVSSAFPTSFVIMLK
jgi:hypothetical protein